jgi:nicotinamide mononucleotide transporter
MATLQIGTAMPDLLSVNTIFFTVLDYPMSFVEFFGTVLYLVSVWLIARKNVWTWPTGILSVALYMALFYQFQLYSDALEQVYFLGASFYGWWFWARARSQSDTSGDFGFSSARGLAAWASATLVLGIALGFVMTNIHLWATAWFPVPASFPFVDALTTIMSLSAMWLLARKRAESWIYWIVIDVVAIWLYFTKGISFVGWLYVVLLGIAVYGFQKWVRDNAKTGKRDVVNRT